MNIIWTKEELTKIKTRILSPAKMIINENNKSIEQREETTTTSYTAFKEEIENLLFIQDRNIIKETLNEASKVKANTENPLHLGLVSSLSKINTTDDTQIFEILKQIISQYERIISQVLKKSVNDMNLSLQDRIKKLNSKLDEINSNIETDEENEIKEIMSTIFNYTNNIDKNPLFSSVIEKYDIIIKKRIKSHLISSLKSAGKLDDRIKESDFREYMRTEYNKNLRKRMQSRNANPFIR